MTRTLHLFAGAGGCLLADLILGHNPIGAVEIDPYCCSVLRERANDGWFPGLTVHECDVREFDPGVYCGRVDCISAGFPCQDISAAGRGEGITGERSGLVSEVWRAIDAIRPKFVFLENSPAIRTRGRTEVIKQLVARGYSWRDGTIKASDVGALHIRQRWFLLAADSNGMRELELERYRSVGAEWRLDCYSTQEITYTDGIRNERESKFTRGDINQWNKPERCAENPSYALRDRLQVAVQQGWVSETDAESIQASARYTGEYDWLPTDSGVLRVVLGMADQFHSNKGARIKALGNGQVPLQAAAAWVMLAR
jgi:DNA (cytosine-5)-methyltransferase 1